MFLSLYFFSFTAGSHKYSQNSHALLNFLLLIRAYSFLYSNSSSPPLALGLHAICCLLHTVQLQVVRTARYNLNFNRCRARPRRRCLLLACVPRQRCYLWPIKGEHPSPSRALAAASADATLVKSLAIYLLANSASQHAVVSPPPQHHLRREIHNTKGSSCFDSPLLSCCRRRACARCVDPPYTAQPSSSRLIWTAAVTSIIGRSVAGAGHCRRFAM
jgi:hypothetical protein